MINNIISSPGINHFPAENASDNSLSLEDNEIIRRAILCLEKGVKQRALLNNPQAVGHYLQLNLAQEKNEVFAVIFLDCKNRALAFEKLFYGTINTSAVHPRLVVERALFHNAGTVIFAHNHPSGDIDPSTADLEITKKLKSILKIIDTEVLDHFIVSLKGYYSFAEYGML